MFYGFGGVVDDVPYKIRRSAVKGLLAEAVGARVQAEVAQDANVIHGPVSLHKVVVDIGNEVIIDIDGNEHPVLPQHFFHRIDIRVGVSGIAVRDTVGSVVDAVVEIHDVVIADDVTGPADLDRIFG